MENNKIKLSKTLLYIGPEGAVTLDVLIDKQNETMWATQKTMANLFKKIKKLLVNICKIYLILKN